MALSNMAKAQFTDNPFLTERHPTVPATVPDKILTKFFVLSAYRGVVCFNKKIMRETAPNEITYIKDYGSKFYRVELPFRFNILRWSYSFLPNTKLFSLIKVPYEGGLAANPNLNITFGRESRWV